jgi:hypothetical protein
MMTWQLLRKALRRDFGVTVAGEKFLDRNCSETGNLPSSARSLIWGEIEEI